MAQSIRQAKVGVDNDIVGLYSHLGESSANMPYVECKRAELAIEAERRWSLLMDIRKSVLGDARSESVNINRAGNL